MKRAGQRKRRKAQGEKGAPLPYYSPPEYWQHDSEQALFNTIARLYPCRIEDLARDIYPIYKKAVSQHHRDSAETKGLQQTYDRIKRWQQTNRLEQEWVTDRVNQIFVNWYMAEKEGWYLLEQRYPAIFGIAWEAPEFLGDLQTFTFTYKPRGALTPAASKARMNQQFKEAQDTYLIALRKAYTEAGWKQSRERPARTRDLEVFVHRTIKDLSDQEIGDRVGLDTKNTEKLKKTINNIISNVGTLLNLPVETRSGKNFL